MPHRWNAFAVVVVAGAGAAALASAATPEAASTPKVIEVISIDVSEKSADVPPKGTSAGDSYTDNTRLVNAVPQFGRAKGLTVGRGYLKLTTTAGKTLKVVMSTTLPGGVIRVNGPVSTAGTTHAPIVGGSGAYAHVTGTVSFYDLPGRPAHKELDVYRLVYH